MDEKDRANVGQRKVSFLVEVMALATTLAGNLTILGAVANIIVVESARDHVEIGFWDYAKYGIPVTILTTVAGMVILLALG